MMKLDPRIEKYFGSDLYKIPFLTKQEMDNIMNNIQTNIDNGIEKYWKRVDIHFRSYFIDVVSPDYVQMRIWDNDIEFRANNGETVKTTKIFLICLSKTVNQISFSDRDLSISDYKKEYKMKMRKKKFLKLTNK